MAQLEKAGVPTVSFVAKDFVKAWQRSAAVFGVKELPLLVVPRPFGGLKPEALHPDVDAVFELLVARLTNDTSQDLAHEDARETELIVVPGEDRFAALEQMNRLFLDRAWGDGFPLWPPTRERVDRMLRGTRRAPMDVVAVLDPGKGVATVEKIAINAVMAGCEPAHLPVLIAAVEAISDPHFMLRSVAMSTGPHAPLMLINGPIVDKLGVNTGRCALGPGAQSAVNTALGRAIRLIYLNVGHAYPGVMDMDTLGSPTKYSLCLGEAEAASPWEPFHVEKGFDRDASIVTMFSTYALSEVSDGVGVTPEEILSIACVTACNQAIPSVGYWLRGWRADVQAGVEALEKCLLLVCPVHAEIFRKAGWGKQQVREYMYKHARVPFARFMANKEASAFRSSHPDLQWLWDSPETLIPVFETPDCLDLVVAGAMGGARSTYSYGAAEPVSRLIEG